jgi:hypothetical protein
MVTLELQNFVSNVWVVVIEMVCPFKEIVAFLVI